MSDRNHLQNSQPYDDDHAALVSAFALGQLTGEEALAIEAQVARDPALQRDVSETRRLAGLVAESLRADPLPKSSLQLRETLDNRAAVNDALKVTLPQKRRSRWVEAVVGVAICGSLALLALPAVQSSREAARRAQASNNLKQISGPPGQYYSRDDVQRTRSDRALPSEVTLFNGQQPYSRTHTEAGRELESVDQSGGGQKGQGQGSGQAMGEGQPGDVDDVILAQSGRAVAPQRVEGEPTMEYRSTLQPGVRSYTDGRGKMLSGPFGNGQGASDRPVVVTTNPTYLPSKGNSTSVDQLKSEKAHLVRLKDDSESLMKNTATGTTFTLREGREVGEPATIQGESELDVYGRRTYVRSNSEQYDEIIENAFLPAKMAPLSTFSIDVDTASYANTRRFLASGQLPPRDAVRIEELINYFRYDDPQPQGNAPFSANMELAECPWTPGHHLLRVGLQAKSMHNQERPASNLVFLLDVSGSMSDQNKLPLVKQAMNLLIRELSEKDRVTIVTYAGSEGVALESTSGDQKDRIINAVNNLQSNGSTHASAGITLAYNLAQQQFIKEGANRVILCTDGDFNVGVTSDEALVDLITSKAKSGVFLSVMGFGMGNLKDSKMEKLADKGNGNYAYIDTLREARKVLVEQMSGSLVTVAKDVKIQIEFNPAVVAAYRQIGYENRVLAAKDFNDDTKDAGEIGAGHAVTALYEVVLVGQEKFAAPPANKEIPLKYQKAETKVDDPVAEATPQLALTEAAASGEILTLKLRFKQPDGEKSELVEFPLKQAPKKFGAASENLRFASAVAAFGMILRESQYRGGASMSAVEEIAAAALGSDPSGYRTEFLELVRKAEGLGK